MQFWDFREYSICRREQPSRKSGFVKDCRITIKDNVNFMIYAKAYSCGRFFDMHGKILNLLEECDESVALFKRDDKIIIKFKEGITPPYYLFPNSYKIHVFEFELVNKDSKFMPSILKYEKILLEMEIESRKIIQTKCKFDEKLQEFGVMTEEQKILKFIENLEK